MFTVSTPCFLSFGTFERVFLEEALFLGVMVRFGGREGALASALISQQSILKQGFQKTHFPMVLEVEFFCCRFG